MPLVVLESETDCNTTSCTLLIHAKLNCTRQPDLSPGHRRAVQTGIGDQGRQGDCSIRAEGEDLNNFHASLDYLL